MFNDFLFSLGNFGKICLPHPYTMAPLIFWFTDKFVQILLIGVTIFLVKQTDFALVQPSPKVSNF